MAYLRGQVISGSSALSGSKFITGSLEVFSDNGQDIFIIKSGSYESLKVNSDGILQFHIFEDSYTPPVTPGGIFFHSSSMYVGLDE
jgi:hypothetical protein